MNKSWLTDYSSIPSLFSLSHCIGSHVELWFGPLSTLWTHRKRISTIRYILTRHSLQFHVSSDGIRCKKKWVQKYIYFFCAIAILLWATAAFSDYWWALLLRRKASSFPKFTLGLHRLDFFVGAASSRSLVTSLSVSKDLNNSSILTAWIGTDEVSSAQESLECEDWKREKKKAQQILIRKGKSSLSQTQASNSLSPILSRVMLNLCWRFGLFPLDDLQMCE